jgi:transcriptional regulator with XRE-family HTH domain
MLYNFPGKKIKDIREDCDIHQYEIARVLGISPSAYSRYENGEYEFPLKMLIGIANYFGTSLDFLAGLTSNPVPYRNKPPRKTKLNKAK